MVDIHPFTSKFLLWQFLNVFHIWMKIFLLTDYILTLWSTFLLFTYDSGIVNIVWEDTFVLKVNWFGSIQFNTALFKVICNNPIFINLLLRLLSLNLFFIRYWAFVFRKTVYNIFTYWNVYAKLFPLDIFTDSCLNEKYVNIYKSSKYWRNFSDHIIFSKTLQF